MSRANPAREVVLSAAGVAEEDLPVAAEFDASLPPDLEFETVPRRERTDGLTPERQRIFIKMLSVCGSVRTAAKAISCSNANMYNLRNSPGAESFAAAWEKAVERGARRILDVLVDQAINGTPEYLYKDGQLVGERRHFNTRAMMWIVAHNFPEKYGVTGGLMHSANGPIALKRLKKQWRKEWDAEQMEKRRVRGEKLEEDNRKGWRAIREGFKRKLKADPEKRKAWELLTGPTDWGDLSNLPNYWGEVETNYNRPDMVVTMAAIGFPERLGEDAEPNADGSEDA